MMPARPGRGQEWNRHQRNSRERKTRCGKEHISNETAPFGKQLPTQRKLPLHEEENDKDGTKNRPGVLIKQRRRLDHDLLA